MVQHRPVGVRVWGLRRRMGPFAALPGAAAGASQRLAAAGERKDVNGKLSKPLE